MTTRSIETVMVLGLAAVAAAGCSRHKAEKPPARPVHVEAVQAEGAEPGLRYSASIQPYEQVALAFKASGYVVSILQRPGADGRPRNVQQGDQVTRGTVLARVNPADYSERVNQASAQVADAEARLARAKADAARAEALYKAQALTRPDYDAATASLASATASADGAKAQLESARIALGDASLVAPADGVILARNVEVGSLAAVGATGFTLADLTRVKAVFGVPDLLVERVKVGTPLHLTSDAFGATQFPGHVTAVSPSADVQSRVFNIEVTIPNTDRRLKAGMIATVEVAAEDVRPGSAPTAPQVPTVSVAAVVKSKKPGAFAVFVADGTGEEAVARSRDVTLGTIAGNRVTVSGGLAVGERVVVSGASLLNDGDPVRVIPGGEGK